MTTGRINQVVRVFFFVFTNNLLLLWKQKKRDSNKNIYCNNIFVVILTNLIDVLVFFLQKKPTSIFVEQKSHSETH